MATTQFGVNHALAVKLWAKKLAVEALKATSWGPFVGEDANSLIQIKSETQKGPGDQVTFGLRAQLTGRGVQGTETLEGNEEALTLYNDAVVINEIAHAVRSGAPNSISQQRVPFNIREEALDGLKDWFANRFDTWFFNQMCGFTPETDTIYTGNQAVIAPDASHRIWSETSTTADEDLDSTGDTFNVNLINTAVERAKTLTTPIRPIKMGGKEWYVCFLHPYQVTDLRNDANTVGSWFDIQQSALQGGEITNNPIFTGALGVINQTILLENSRVTNGVNSSTGAADTDTRRAVFCGAQAAAIAFGQNNGPDEYTWVEQMFDYERQLGVSAQTIAGLKKTRFNSADYGVITISTYAVAH